MIALLTLFDPGAAGELTASYELRLADQPFAARVAGGRLDVSRGSADRPDATIDTDPETLAEVLWHGRPLAEALGSGRLEIEGSRAAARRFLKLFPLPGA